MQTLINNGLCNILKHADSHAAIFRQQAFIGRYFPNNSEMSGSLNLHRQVTAEYLWWVTKFRTTNVLAYFQQFPGQYMCVFGKSTMQLLFEDKYEMAMMVQNASLIIYIWPQALPCSKLHTFLGIISQTVCQNP